jgi:hypothetical protein
MIRIRGVATALGLALVIASGVAHAQETTGRVTGRIVDQDTGAPLAGVTVIAQGPQGEEATITDDRGQYDFTSLKVGTYVLRFYVANTSTQAEQPGVVVSAEKTVRVNAKIAGSAQAAAQQTYVITGKAPAVDVGSTRIGYTFDQELTLRAPMGRTYGEVIQKAPGAFVDPTGNVSIGGSTGLENIYIVNGLNVTGMEMGNLEAGVASLGGGTNLPIEFLQQIDVSSGGFQAEFGGGMGGVINTILKSGTNQFHGSAFLYDAPYWLSGAPKIALNVNSPLAGERRLDFDTSIGAEVGGPIIKDKLFFWAGFAPRSLDSHVFRLVYAQQEALDAGGMGTGTGAFDANGNRVQSLEQRRRLNESRQTYSYAATMDYVARPEHKLTLSIWGTPSLNNQLRAFNHQEVNSYFPADPNGDTWARESLTKTNTDFMAHWVSKFFDRHWQLDVSAGLHNEYFNDRGPGNLNTRNQLEFWGANLPQLEADAPAGCATTASGFHPCQLADQYRTGGFGQIKTFTGNRWLGEVKSTHIAELGGHHELKYGWRMEYSQFDQDRYYSGPIGARNLVQIAPNGGNPVGVPNPYYSTYSFFTLQPGEYPTDYGPGTTKPFTNLLTAPQYQDHLKANVSSLSNALFAQESYSPQGLRNLTVNVGARYEFQKMSDLHGQPFLDTGNFGPRLGAVYDPMSDGRSKMSVSYGRFFETIPMNLAARYFGGEGILVRNGVPLSTCAQPDATKWTGAGEAFKQCDVPAKGATPDAAQGGSTPFNNGSNYPVQSHLAGQYHNEVVATVERELMEDLTLRLDYQHRWLGNIIEDGTADPSGSFSFVLANPGNVPKEALADAKHDVDLAMAKDQMDPVNASQLAAAQGKLANLQGLAAAPKPERTYDAITLSLNKRFSHNLQGRASYTYSRLVGNYEGLYQSAGDYFAPNGDNSYDTPDLYINQRGRLPNDRPHQARLDGYYTHEVGKGAVTLGLSFSGRSGVPRNYVSSWYFGQPQNMLLPRGSAGRTPPVTQFDAKVMYGRALSPTVNLDAFIDIFNVFNQQATIASDDVYTYEMSSAIVNGTPSDLKFAKNVFGAPVTKNLNFGHALAYQAPINARMGLRLSF